MAEGLQQTLSECKTEIQEKFKRESAVLPS